MENGDDKYFRKIICEKEKKLNKLATKSFDKEAIERDKKDYPNPYRTPFQRDRDRIIHSKAFRRLMHKTQVFVKPDSEHIRTRLTHTLEVMQISRSIARAIDANEDLTESIALGHDLGHTPFGHIGEDALNKKLKEYNLFFKHNIQSYRIVDYLEKYVRFPNGGLNLTKAVKFGILRHSGKFNDGNEKVEIYDRDGNNLEIEYKQTLEEKIVRISDDIAWLNHDWEDGIKSGLLSNSLLGNNLIIKLGFNQADRINNMVKDVIENFRKTENIDFSPEMEQLKKELYEKIDKYLWNNEIIKRYNSEAERIISVLFDFFIEYPDKLPDETKNIRKFDPKNKIKTVIIVTDYISGMTDDWCLRNYESYIYSPYSLYKKIVFPKEFKWLTIKNKSKINLPENLNIEDGLKFKIYNKNCKIFKENKNIFNEQILKKYVLGECIYKKNKEIEIIETFYGKKIKKDDVLIIDK